MDSQPVNLDGFAFENPELGLASLASPADPEPSLLVRDGRVVELDSRPADEFDVIDEFIARHGLDLAAAPEAMALDDVAIARLMVDPGVPRRSLVELAGGLTPAKLARVVALLQPHELMMAAAKLRARRTPANQAHVTNRLDDPMLLAADAATAAAFGFRELETTVPVLGDAPSNAVAVTIGAAVTSGGVLVQCSVEEALELQLGMRGLASYAETVSLYGTEAVFVDGDDTPWSKALLASAYASRGMKMRVSSGAGAEVLMGDAEGRAMLYLESRCVSLARALGSQGVQNGGIDGASIVSSVPRGVRELMCENVMVMARGMESCSGNDSLMSESDLRRVSRTLPILLAGSDFICSGFGSIQRYDNMFGPSQWNAEDIDDFLVIQRDWGVDGGLNGVGEDVLAALRRRAAEAVRAVYGYLGLADFGADHVDLVVDAAGSKDLGPGDPLAVLGAAQIIQSAGITAIDVVRALYETGFDIEAQRLLDMLAGPRQRGLPADRRDLRSGHAGAVRGHGPQRLRRPGHGIPAHGRAAGPDRRDPPAAGRVAPARRAAAVRRPVAGSARRRDAGHRPAGRGDRRVPRRGPGGLAHAVRDARGRRARGAAGRARGGGLPRPGRPGEQLHRPGPDRAHRGPAGRQRDRHWPAGQGHRADPPPRPVPAGEPGAVQHRAGHHARTCTA